LELLGHHASSDERLRAELLIELGTAQRLAGDVAHRETLLDAAHLAERLGDTEQLVRAALANNRGTLSSVGAVDAERVAVLEAALAATSGDSHERARLLATLAVELTEGGDWPHRRSLAQQAVAMARRLSDPETLVRVFNLLYFCMSVPETLEERLSMTAEAVALGEGLSDPALQHFTHRFRVYACAEAGDVDGIDAHLSLVAQKATAVGDPSLTWAVAFIRSGRAILAGNLEEAETLAAEALQIGSNCGMPEAAWVFAMQMLAIRRQQDRLVEMEEALTRAADESPTFPMLRALLAALYCEVDKSDKAQGLLEVDAANNFADFSYELTWLDSMAAYAEACARLGNIETAGRLYERLAPWHQQFVFASAVAPAGAVAFYLGMLATVLTRYDRAAAHFSEAMEIHERLRAPYWIACTRLEWARVLLTRRQPGDTDRARQLLGQALATARELGLANVERRAVELLKGQ
jgi:tetratricopeptide (TPR) repeat protein